jgi:hypothetical protein
MTSLDDLVMLRWTDARAALAERKLRLRVLAPPYPALGLGALRCLRVIPLPGADDAGWELTVGYEGYERL